MIWKFQEFKTKCRNINKTFIVDSSFSHSFRPLYMWWCLLDYQLFLKKLSLRLKKEKHLQGRKNFLTVKVGEDVAYWRRPQSDRYFMPVLVHLMCKCLGTLPQRWWGWDGKETMQMKKAQNRIKKWESRECREYSSNPGKCGYFS